MAGAEDDKTILAGAARRTSPPHSPGPGPGRRLLLWAAVASLVVIGAVVYYAFFQPPSFPIGTADRAGILGAHPQKLLIFRYSNDQRVIVLVFPTLHQQGEMLNRVAAFVEKAGVPHDRVLTDAELAGAIKASGSTPDDYYYGHDYRVADLVRFFRLMALDHVQPNDEEQRLHALMGFLHWFRPGAVGALITLPGPGKVAGLDAKGRATILEHELSHGAYFTIPAYDAYVHRFYYSDLDDHDRVQFRQFLASEGYDPANTDLIINETLAYLMFTPDPRFFSAAVVGLPPARIAALQRAFWPDIPVAWLKRFVPEPAPLASPAAAQAAVKPRRRRSGPLPRRHSARLDRHAAKWRRAPNAQARDPIAHSAMGARRWEPGLAMTAQMIRARAKLL